MQKNAIVRSLETPDAKKKNLVIVEPISFTECAGCTQACSKRNSNIAAVNVKNFKLKPGYLVTIATSKVHEAVEGIIALCFPVIMAVTGFFLSNPIFQFIQKNIKKDGTSNAVCPEGFKALIVVIFFALAAFIVLKISRAKFFPGYPEITDVLEQEN